jgi:hypothetical protein
MPVIASLTTFSANTRAKAAEVNANFSLIRTTVNTYGAFLDVNSSVTGTWTFDTSPVFPDPVTFALAVTVTAGGLTVTAGGLTVSAGGAAITGNSTVTGTLTTSGALTVSSGGASITGTVTATTFSGSGASLTNLPSSALTGALPALSGASLTALNASELTSGTVATARLPTSYTALTVTTLTGTTAIVPTLQGAASTPRNKINLGDSATELLTFTAASNLVKGNGGAATGAPSNGPTGYATSCTHTNWIPFESNGQVFWIPGYAAIA